MADFLGGVISQTSTSVLEHSEPADVMAKVKPRKRKVPRDLQGDAAMTPGMQLHGRPRTPSTPGSVCIFRLFQTYTVH